jgi:hypothetical protein
MTPKEKAIELVNKYWDLNLGWLKCCQCALIAVDEILDAIVIINEYDFEPLNQYWQEVKKEIENL